MVKRQYIDVNIPVEWKPHLQTLLEDPVIQSELDALNLQQKLSSLGRWIIREYLIEHTDFRFKHVNTWGDTIMLRDRRLHRHVNLRVVPRDRNSRYFYLRCEECKTTDCPHIRYAVDEIPQETVDLFEEKGWYYKATESPEERHFPA